MWSEHCINYNHNRSTMIQQSTAPYLHSVNSIAHHVWSRNETVYAYKIIKWHPMQQIPAAVCLELSISLVNSCEETMNQEQFVLG